MGAAYQTLTDGRRDLVFCSSTMTALVVDAATRRALDRYQGGEDLASACLATGAAPGRVESVITRLRKPPSPESPSTEETATEAPPPHEPTLAPAPGLDRLVLNVSSRCNLRCRYCYAGAGEYGQPGCSMSRETALGAVRWAVRSFGRVRSIQFFGGEPLLSPRRIVEVCEYCRALGEAKALTEVPRFGLVTNGTLADAGLHALLERYDIGVTVSIDGPAEVHDALRGAGSFTRSDRFALRCLEERPGRIEFECTWTAVHRQQGISVVDLVEFFHRRYGVRVLHVVPVSVPRTSHLYLPPEVISEEFERAARFALATLAGREPRCDTFSYRVIEALAKRRPIRHYCPAGIGTLCVAADGGLYPCFMLVGRPELRIGHVTADGALVDDRREAVSGALEGCLKSNRDCCRDCWAAPFCFGCIGGDLIESSDLCQPTKCELVQIVAKTVLLERAEVEGRSKGRSE